MKKTAFIFMLILLNSSLIFAHNIKELSDFRIMGEIKLREKPGFSEKILYKTINHEGGMKLRVMEVSNRDSIENKDGIWLRILTRAPMWVESGDWIEKHSYFWIFLEDERIIYDYEE